MAIQERQMGPVTVFDVSGKLTIGRGDAELRDALHTAFELGRRDFLFNLEGVRALDSSGVGELVASKTSVENRGGRLKLVGLNPKVSEVLQVTQLVGIFESYPDEESALASY